MSRLIAAFSLTALPFWMSLPLVAIRLTDRGLPPWIVGLFGAAPYGGMVVVALLAPGLGARLRPLLAYRLAVGAILLATAGLALSRDAAVWFVAVVFLGGGFGTAWAIGDSVVAGSAPPERRGRVVGLYETAASAAIGGGPLISLVLGTKSSAAFTAAAILAALGQVVITGARLPVFNRPGPGALVNLMSMLRRQPHVLMTSALGGLLEGATVALLPVYGLHLGVSSQSAGAMATALGLGNLAAQYPVGRLADRNGPTSVIGWTCGAVALGALALPVVAGLGGGALLGLVYVWGGTIGTVYTLAVLQAGAALALEELMPAVAAMMIAYTLGSFAGPLIGGLAQSLAPAFGLPLTLATVALIGGGAIILVARRTDSASA